MEILPKKGPSLEPELLYMYESGSLLKGGLRGRYCIC
jgi:hypothetical protein